MRAIDRVFLGAAMAGILAGTAARSARADQGSQATSQKMTVVPCYGLNACKGKGECGSKTDSNGCSNDTRDRSPGKGRNFRQKKLHKRPIDTPHDACDEEIANPIRLHASLRGSCCIIHRTSRADLLFGCTDELAFRRTQCIGEHRDVGLALGHGSKVRRKK